MLLAQWLLNLLLPRQMIKKLRIWYLQAHIFFWKPSPTGGWCGVYVCPSHTDNVKRMNKVTALNFSVLLARHKDTLHDWHCMSANENRNKTFEACNNAVIGEAVERYVHSACWMRELLCSQKPEEVCIILACVSKFFGNEASTFWHESPCPLFRSCMCQSDFILF